MKDVIIYKFNTMRIKSLSPKSGLLAGVLAS